ncbi:MAG: hypothetical protein H0W02_04180 [Ktedonobacteraceae bacterium]|nr:hypothetical protein [Ktedonobacteraceae bacterium]
MSYSESEGRITPPSALRYRPSGSSISHKEKGSAIRRASRPRSADVTSAEDGDVVTEPHKLRGATQSTSKRSTTPTSPPTHKTAPPPARPQEREKSTQAGVSHQPEQRRHHPLLYIGIGMLAMLALWTILLVAVNWVGTTWDDLHYGRPRTFQIDAVVGHNDSAANPSHFMAVNLHSRIEIIEIAGNDPAHTRMYVGPQLYGSSNNDLVPVTLSFTDVNGDNKPDMIISFQNSRAVFLNDQGGFRAARPDEQPQIQQALQHLGMM